MRAVVKQNPTLSGVIDVVDFAAERNGERDINPAKLRGVVETFSDPRYRLGLADVQPDFLGRAYEYLLRKFAEGSGQSAGEFFTPTEVGFLMAHIMRPRPGEECHDYACGSAGLLVKLQLVARELDPTSKVPLKLTGQELQAESYAVAQMNAIIHDMDIEIARGDTMINPKFRTADGKVRTHDIVVANPMWNQPFDPDIFANDPFDRFRTAGGITTGKGDWAWLQHTLCLSQRSWPGGGGARHWCGHARLGLEERGQGAQHPQVVRRSRSDRRRDPAARQPLLQHHRGRRDRRAEQAQARRAQGQDRASQRQPAGDRRAGPRTSSRRPTSAPLAAAFLKGEPVEGEVAVISRQQAEEADYNLSPSRWVGPSTAGEEADLKDILDRFDVIIAAEADISQDLGAALAKLRALS